jgi:hypothetical protein
VRKRPSRSRDDSPGATVEKGKDRGLRGREKRSFEVEDEVDG